MSEVGVDDILWECLGCGHRISALQKNLLAINASCPGCRGRFTSEYEPVVLSEKEKISE